LPPNPPITGHRAIVNKRMLKDAKKNDGSGNGKQTRLNARLESGANATVIGSGDGNSRNYVGRSTRRSGQD